MGSRNRCFTGVCGADCAGREPLGGPRCDSGIHCESGAFADRESADAPDEFAILDVVLGSIVEFEIVWQGAPDNDFVEGDQRDVLDVQTDENLLRILGEDHREARFL